MLQGSKFQPLFLEKKKKKILDEHLPRVKYYASTGYKL